MVDLLLLSLYKMPYQTGKLNSCSNSKWGQGLAMMTAEHPNCLGRLEGSTQDHFDSKARQDVFTF